GFVEGSYVYVGVVGGASTWTPSATSWQQLSVTFTTGASQTSIQVFVHGWYAQPTYFADDLSLTGGTGGGGSPSASASASASQSPSPSPSPSSTGGGGGGPVGKVAPYVDMTNNQEPMLNSAAQAGLKTYTA